MPKTKFKALIPFSYKNMIYNPSDEKPGIEDAGIVRKWAAAKYCEILEDVKEKEEETPETPPEEPTKNDQAKEPGTEEVEGEQEPPEDEKEAETAANEPKSDGKEDDFEKMTYPQLKKAAKAAGIEGYHAMKMVKLKEALRKKG